MKRLLQTGCVVCSGNRLEIPEAPPAAGEEPTNQLSVCLVFDSPSPPGFNHPCQWEWAFFFNSESN